MSIAPRVSPERWSAIVDPKFISALYQLLGIEGNPSSAYHPQTDGQTEHINQELEWYLHVFINHRQTDWADWLPIAEFSYNDKTHQSTGHSPFFLNTGQHPWKGNTPWREVLNESIQAFVDRLKEVQEEAAMVMKKAQEDMKRVYDRKWVEAREYKRGDSVWLEGTNIRTDRPMKKLEDKRYGPFKVIQKVGQSAYKLDILKSWRGIHPVVNKQFLLPFIPPSFPSQQKHPPKPPKIIDGEECWEVEEVVDSKFDRQQLWYHVRWKDRPYSEWQWVPLCKNEKSPQSQSQNSLSRTFFLHFLWLWSDPQVTRTTSVFREISSNWHPQLFLDLQSLAEHIFYCSWTFLKFPAFIAITGEFEWPLDDF